MTTEDSPAVDGFGNEVFQAKYILKQKPPPSPDDPSMKTYISTFPPLGQVSLVDQDTTNLTALLEVDESRASDPWEVLLWHLENGEWQGTPLVRSQDVSKHPTYLRGERQAAAHLYFVTHDAIPLPRSFTVKFRPAPDQSWRWAKDHQGIQDGSVVLRTVTAQEAISTSLGDYIEHLNPELKYTNHRSQSRGTTLWEVSASVPAASSEQSTFVDVSFGLPWGGGKFSRYATMSTHFKFWTKIVKVVWFSPLVDSLACSSSRQESF